MTHLYILQSLKNGRRYVGVTRSLIDRLKKHNDRMVLSTKKDAPYKIVYSESFDDLKTARQREKFLKTTQGHRVIENKLLGFLARQKEGGLPKSDRVGAAQSAAET